MEGSASEAPSTRKHEVPHTRGGWQRYIEEPGDLKFGIGAGWLFVVVVVLLQELGCFPQDPDFAADKIVPYIEGVVQHKNQVRPFVFVDINDQTYREWQQPLFTPRDKLAALIRTAAEGNPAAIIVDIDLSRTSDCPFLVERVDDIHLSPTSDCEPVDSEPKSCDSLKNNNDKKLCTAIIDASMRVPIILARNFVIGAREPESGGAFRPLPSFLDPVFETGPRFAKAGSRSALWASPEYPNVFWASPLYNLDEERTIRHWRLWEPACIDGRLEAMPSTQLLAAALVQPNPAGHAAVGVVKSYLQMRSRPAPACTENDPKLDRPQFRLGQLDLDLSDTSFGQRIVYTLNKEVGLRTTVPIAAEDSGDRHPAQEEEVPILLVISARDLAPGPGVDRNSEGNTAENARKEASHGIHSDIFRKRIVVIGASHHESGDNHWTPMGTMPGALVNINAIHTLLDYGQLQSPLWISRILFSGAIVSIIAILFHVLNYSIAGLLSSFVLVISIALVNYFTLPQSILLDLSLAGLLYIFYKWFVIVFFYVLKKGWKVENVSWRVWEWREWRISKNDEVGWKTLLAARYQKH